MIREAVHLRPDMVTEASIGLPNKSRSLVEELYSLSTAVHGKATGTPPSKTIAIPQGRRLELE